MVNSYDLAMYSNELQTRDGDFIIGVSDEQHIADTLNAFPGWWKEHPGDGVGIFQYMGSAGQEQVIGRSIKLNLTSDGYQVDNPGVTVDSAGVMDINPKAVKI